MQSWLGFKKKAWLTCTLLAVSAWAAQKVDLPLPEKVPLLDESEIVKLAEEEKFTIPLSGSTISHQIDYIPEDSGECKFQESTIQYKSLAQSQAIFENDDNIAAILPLKKREVVIVADPYYCVASYSIDEHYLMKPRVPKTRLTSSTGRNVRPLSPILVATENEEYVYLLTTQSSFMFHYNNIAAETTKFELEGSPKMILKAISSRGFIFLCAGSSGIFIYQINHQDNMKLVLVGHFPPQGEGNSPVDMELDELNQILYVLNFETSIKVYVFDPVAFSETKDKNSLLRVIDEIGLESITVNHKQKVNSYELVGHIDLEISRQQNNQALMVLFSHEGRTMVAELNYQAVLKAYNFVRYFKFSMNIKEIHVIGDSMVVVGEGILGIFPFGINPHLITEEFNGFMTLTPVERIVVTQIPHFLGISKNQLEYGGIYANNEAGLTCHLSASSQLRQIKFRANLTICHNMFELQVGKYCEYEKTFIVRQMEMTASAPVATSLWVATIIFTLLIVVGLCFLFAIHKRKQREIRKLELYFEDKRKSSQIPASSER